VAVDLWESPLPFTASAIDNFLAGVERRAYRLALLACSNEDDALDIVQEAMFTFVRSYAAKPETEWRVLFQRVLQSRITDWHRRSLVRNRLRHWFGLGSDADDDAPDPLANIADSRSETPVATLIRRELAGHLERAITALPLRQQQAFLLRAWEGLDVAETAAAMGCSQGSVKTHYFRAVHALRPILEEYR
jgi:RNA polymerase sigma-70 factor (ECF subfamily)